VRLRLAGDVAGAVGHALSLLRCTWRAENAQAVLAQPRRESRCDLTFLVFLLRRSFAELPPPRSQVALSGGRLRSLECGGLRLSIAHARRVGVGLRARHGRRAKECRSSSVSGFRGLRAAAVRCEVAMFRCSRGQEWVGGRRTGPRRHSEHEGLSAGGRATACGMSSAAQASAKTVVC
jgi:hypothetical protein